MFIRLFLFICVVFVLYQDATASTTTKGNIPVLCTSPIDCADNECCVSSTRPRGRRRRGLMSQPTGTCTPLGQANDHCFMNQMTDSDGAFYVNCPCSSPLTCSPDGYIDQPLGPTGTCQS